MGKLIRLRRSLRGALSIAAFAGLSTTAMLTGLLLLTAWTASDVVRTAGLSYDRVSLYSQIDSAAHAYQAAGYRSVRDPRPETRAEFAQIGLSLASLLARVGELPATTPHDRLAVAVIRRQGQTVLRQLGDASELVRRVDAVWREHGSRAALMEVSRLTMPITVLQATLQREIHDGDAAVIQSTSRTLALIRIAVAASLVGLLLAMGFLLLVQALLHTRLRPGLKRLEEGAQAFGAGQLGHRIGLGGNDELSRLSTAFDTMAQTVAEKQATLREVQLDLERAVAARTRELRHANAALSAADERRRSFLADVSHELRTPLTVIRGETQVALRTADQPGFDPHEVFERILQQTRDLSRMVDDLFLIARAEAGGLPLERKPLDLADIATRVAADFETLACETGGSIRAITDRDVIALVDPDRLRRALAALIENALRHCQAGVNIELDVRAIGDDAVIAVCDDGPGIDPALASQLFQRFRRGETRGEGSGLGLSLVSALVEAHGGAVRLEPRAGGGTRAVMRFPLSLPARAAA